MNRENIVELLEPGDKIIIYTPELCRQLQLNEENIRILSQVGIPSSVAPFITFYDVDKGGGQLSKT